MAVLLKIFIFHWECFTRQYHIYICCICYSLYMELWHIKENENGSKIKNRMWTFLEWI